MLHHALTKALTTKLFNNSGIFYDLTSISNRIATLNTSFSNNFLHCFAMKASPVAGVLQHVHTNGMGIEVATRPELVHALHLGISSDKIVYDSPCKTWNDLEFALQQKVYINADNLQEIERLEKLMKSSKYSPAGIGLRINPQVGSGKIEATSTATMTSKFGTAYDQYKEKILEVFKKNSWMNGIHCHIGSQGCELELMVAGIKKVFGLVKEINAQKKQITWIDIGGGLPVNYEADNDSPTFAEYAQLLKREVPELFSGEYKVITEFGRSIVAKSGWVASKVEYTKMSGNKHIAIIHVGADLFVRTAYMPNVWKHRISVLQQNGLIQLPPAKNSEKDLVQDIAGPLCFSGDLIARNLSSNPLLNVGDWVVIHDTGAYTLSMWSKYNSRQVPGVYGYTYDSGKPDSIQLQVLKKPETMEQALSFWN